LVFFASRLRQPGPDLDTLKMQVAGLGLKKKRLENIMLLKNNLTFRSEGTI
jgi:hypothetical protein